MKLRAYPSHSSLVPLIAPVQWQELPSRVDRWLQLFLKLDWPLDSYGVTPTTIEPWTLWKGPNRPTEEVDWNPLVWFQGEANEEIFACSTLSNSLFGQLRLTLEYDQDDHVLSVIVDPVVKPLSPYALVFAIVVCIAIAQESRSFIRSQHGCCGPHREMAFEQVMRTTECQGPHTHIEEAIKEVVMRSRRSFLKVGMEPLL